MAEWRAIVGVCIIILVVTIVFNGCDSKLGLRVSVMRNWMRLHSVVLDRRLSACVETKLKMYFKSNKRKVPFLLVGSSTLERGPTEFGDRQFVNLAVGSISTHHLVEHADLLSQLNAQLVVLYVGVNDINRGADTDTIVDRMERIMQSLSTKRLIYVPIIESPYQELSGQLAQVQEVNARVIQLLSSRNHTKIAELSALEADDFGADRLHLSGSGNEKLRELLEQTMSESGS